MVKPTRECRIIADGGLITPCKNCGRYHGSNEGFNPRPKLDFSYTTARDRQLIREAITKNMPIIEKGVAKSKSEYYRRRWLKVKRQYNELKEALEEVED